MNNYFSIETKYRPDEFIIKKLEELADKSPVRSPRKVVHFENSNDTLFAIVGHCYPPKIYGEKYEYDSESDAWILLENPE